MKPRPSAAATALQRASDRAGGEASAALHSSDRVKESLARVRAAERKVADALPGEVVRSGHSGNVNPLAASIRGLLRDRNRIREAFVLSEVLGEPRGANMPFAGR